MNTRKSCNWAHATLCGLSLALAIASTGCQITEGGQTLPSGYYLEDDVQYFPAGPEFKLLREATAMQAYQAEQQLEQLPPAP